MFHSEMDVDQKKIEAKSGACALVMTQGAHIVSWRTAEGAERLFMSPLAQFSPGVAIRGGVPIIFPQFAALGPLPKHGFARVLPWRIESHEADAIELSLVATEETGAIWPHHFAVRYRVSVTDDSLHMRLSVANAGDAPFSFTAALHTYLRVQDIAAVSVSGLQGCRYRDSVKAGAEGIDPESAVRFAGEVDRIYFSAMRPIQMREAERLTVQADAEGFHDVVVWNPGPELSRKLPDMEDEGYRQMVCIEAAAIDPVISLQPGEQWQGVQRLTLC